MSSAPQAGARSTERRPTRRLPALLLATCFALSAVLLTHVAPLGAGRMSKPTSRLFGDFGWWAFLGAHRPEALDSPAVVAAVLLLGAGLGFLACFGGLWLTWRGGDAWTRRLVIGVSVGATLLSVFAPPTMNSNPYNYMYRARVMAAYGENPYTTAAGEFPDDPLAEFANPAYTGGPGGKLPTWMVVNVAVAWIAQGNVALNLLLLRFTLFLFGVGTVLLVSRAAERLVPERAVAGLVLWAWNPIFLLNIQTRTDTVMVFWLIVGLWLLSRGRRHLAVAAITLSVYVKILTLPFLAIAAISDLRNRRFKELGIGLAVAGVATAVVWLPFLDGIGFDIVPRYLGLANDAGGGASGVAESIGLHQLLLAGFAILVLWTGWTRRDVGRHLIVGFTVVSLYFSAFFAKFASSDYLLTLLAVVAVTMGTRTVALTGALSVSFFLFDIWYTAGTKRFALPDLFPFPRAWVFALPLVAGLLFVGTVLWRRRTRRGTLPG
jgi:hypothetical protein